MNLPPIIKEIKQRENGAWYHKVTCGDLSLSGSQLTKHEAERHIKEHIKTIKTKVRNYILESQKGKTS